MSILDGFEHITRENEPLAAYTYFRLGGPAEYFCEPTSQDELQALLKRCADSDVAVRLLGGGSNVLVREEGVGGVTIRLTAPAFCQIAVADGKLTAGAGAKLSHVVATAAREGLAGMEQFVGIPGAVGGALRGNTGGESGGVGQWTSGAVVMTRTGEIVTRDRDALNFSYRESSLDELAILSGEFTLEAGDPLEITKRMQKTWIEKKASQPPSDQHAGYIFKDPSGASARGLIEDAGLKGASVGGASISSRDANFIIAEPSASSSDVLRLIDVVKAQVSERIGIELEPQIQIW